MVVVTVPAVITIAASVWRARIVATGVGEVTLLPWAWLARAVLAWAILGLAVMALSADKPDGRLGCAHLCPDTS